MTDPIVAARLFAAALLLGCCAGVWYGFLRPLRPRHRALSDLLFLPVLFWVWIWHSFYLCRGDIRIGNALGILLGIVLWEASIGKLLRPVFAFIWKCVGAIFRFLLYPVKIFLKKSGNLIKLLLLSAKKMFTIKCIDKNGGAHYGKIEKPIPAHPFGLPAQLPEAEDPGHRRSGGVHRHTAGNEHRHQRRQGKHRSAAAGGCRTGAAKRRPQ